MYIKYTYIIVRGPTSRAMLLVSVSAAGNAPPAADAAGIFESSCAGDLSMARSIGGDSSTTQGNAPAARRCLSVRGACVFAVRGLSA